MVDGSDQINETESRGRLSRLRDTTDTHDLKQVWGEERKSKVQKRSLPSDVLVYEFDVYEGGSK